MKKLIVFLFIPLVLASVKNSAAAQTINTDSLILQYCKAHHLHPVKSPSGLYYVIHKPGKGNALSDGQTVRINYTGSLLSGKVFDSSTDKKFGHKTPFEFTTGSGQLIKGFEEGIRLVKPGGKILLLIPPALGYGDKDLPSLPANSFLVFEVQLLSAH